MQRFLNLKRGYEGEVLFDSWTEKLQSDCYILNDLLFKANNTYFQIDSLIITAVKIYVYEVKNFEGDYYFEGDSFYKMPQYELTNPLHQLGRSRSLLKQLFLKHNIHLPIEASVIFVNPAFSLYQAPLHQPIILPTQVKKHMRKLNALPGKLHEKHKQMANKLISFHHEKYPNKELPLYSYEDLQKGVPCLECDSILTKAEGNKLLCKSCDHKENLAAAVLRAVEAFKLLFPEKRITTSGIRKWCHIGVSHKRIKFILEKNYKKVGEKRWTHYE
ncbi:nuclease-related domain-containing protein [Virgibacillus oceani]